MLALQLLRWHDTRGLQLDLSKQIKSVTLNTVFRIVIGIIIDFEQLTWHC